MLYTFFVRNCLQMVKSGIEALENFCTFVRNTSSVGRPG